MIMNEVYRIFFQNALLGALAYLPLYLLGIHLQSVWLYGTKEDSIWVILPGVGYLYAASIVLVVLGSLVHSSAIIFVPKKWTLKQRRLAIFVLSPCLPLTIFIIGWCCGNPSMAIHWYIGTIMATIVYGFLSSSKLGPENKK